MHRSGLREPAGSGALTLRIAVARIFNMRTCRRYPAQPDHHGDDIDIDLEEVEIARHLAQLLALAGKFLRDIDRHLAFGHPARAADELLCSQPFQSCTLGVTRELVFDEFPAGIVI